MYLPDRTHVPQNVAVVMYRVYHILSFVSVMGNEFVVTVLQNMIYNSLLAIPKKNVSLVKHRVYHHLSENIDVLQKSTNQES